jgi:hypothetical protein
MADPFSIRPPPLPGILGVPGSGSLIARKPRDVIRQEFRVMHDTAVCPSVAEKDDARRHRRITLGDLRDAFDPGKISQSQICVSPRLQPIHLGAHPGEVLCGRGNRVEVSARVLGE